MGGGDELGADGCGTPGKLPTILHTISMKYSFLFLGLAFLLSCTQTPVSEDAAKGSGSDGLEILDQVLQEGFSPYQVQIPEKDTSIFIQQWDACTDFASCQLKDLTSGQKKHIQIIDKKQEAMLSLFGLGALVLGKKDKVMIIDYTEYKDLQCAGISDPIRKGVGVRAAIFIRNSDSKFKLTSPAQVAAAVELGQLQAELTLQVFGFKNETSRKVLEDFGKSGSVFNVDTYLALHNQVGKIMASMQDTMRVEPVRIPYS